MRHLSSLSHHVRQSVYTSCFQCGHILNTVLSLSRETMERIFAVALYWTKRTAWNGSHHKGKFNLNRRIFARIRSKTISISLPWWSDCQNVLPVILTCVAFSLCLNVVGYSILELTVGIGQTKGRSDRRAGCNA